MVQNDVEKVEVLEKQLDSLGRPRQKAPGRPKGALGRKTLQKFMELQKGIESGKLPLDVMLEHMRFAQDKAHELTKEVIEFKSKGMPKNDLKAMAAFLERFVEMFQELRAWRTLALDAATRAAPYCHPKLNAIAMKISDPEGTRSIVDVNLIAATSTAIDEVMSQDMTPAVEDATFTDDTDDGQSVTTDLPATRDDSNENPATTRENG